MATVFDYLNKLKEENPEYRRFDNATLYKKLRGEDANMPSWGAIDNPSKSSTRKTNQQDPTFFKWLI